MKKMTSTQLWIKLTAVFILLPIYLVLLFGDNAGIVPMLSRLEGYASWFKLVPIGMLIGLGPSLFILIRTGKLAVPTLLLSVVIIGGLLIVNAPNSNPTRSWIIDGDFNIPGQDVYCNGVHLGKTPLTITEEEFYAKVKPWDTPPRQERTTLREHDHHDEHRFSFANFMWIPADFIEYTRSWPDEQMQRVLEGLTKDTDAFALCKETPYWWRFEKDGCIGLTHFGNLTSWGGSGTNSKATFDSNVSVKFPSLDKHFQVLIADLKHNSWQPSDAWMNHFMEYKGMLFGKLYKYAKNHPQAKPALDAVVQREMNIPAGKLSQSQKREVLENVLKRSEKKSEFRIPSFESEAALLACEDSPRMICKYYEKSLGYGSGGHVLSSDSLIRYGNPGPEIRRPIMKWIVSQYKPPQLYHQLVYLAGNDTSMHNFGTNELKLVLNYPRTESEKILEHYLKTKQNQKAGPFGRVHDNDDVIRFLTTIHNPILESRIRQYVADNPGRANFHMTTEQFVRSRIKHIPLDPSLPDWIFHHVNIPEDNKAEMIALLESPNVSHYLQMLSGSNPYSHHRILSQVMGNRYADDFIIFSYHMRNKPELKSDVCNVIWAITSIHTPKIQSFAEEIWKNDMDRKEFLKNLRSCSWNQPKWEWMVPMIAGLKLEEERIIAGSILQNIGTDSAREVLTLWAQEENKKIANSANWNLKKLNEKAAIPNKSVIPEDTMDKLLSGQIKPDDLLPPAVPYIWDGEKYVREKNETKKEES